MKCEETSRGRLPMKAQQADIHGIFAELAPRYELVNHLFTWGLDARWRKRAAAAALQRGGSRWLDVCTGTGEMAIALRRAGGAGAQVVACDFCLPMLQKAAAKPAAEGVEFVAAEVSRLPFADNTFDVVTIAFATRNITSSRAGLRACLEEFRRILCPGGWFINLETSQPPAPIVRVLMHAYVRWVVWPVGRLVSGRARGYGYLSRSVCRFYGAEELSQIMRAAGFSEVRFERLLLGAVAIHRAVK